MCVTAAPSLPHQSVLSNPDATFGVSRLIQPTAIILATLYQSRKAPSKLVQPPVASRH